MIPGKSEEISRSVPLVGTPKAGTGQNSQVAPLVHASQAPPCRFSLCWIEEAKGKQWFKTHKEARYHPNEKVDRESLATEFPHILAHVHSLRLDFIFNSET